MKKLDITWEGIKDTTGYLFSFAKSLSAAVKNSPYNEFFEDIVATSGFAFRMWVAADLCPSATSIWDFAQQKPWVESGGLSCGYIDRLWGQEDVEEERRLAAIEMIKKSIDNGIAAISWDIGVPEWGLIIGYDDTLQKFATLSITGDEGEMDYEQLGKRELPLLNVLIIKGKINKSQEDIISDSLKLAKGHLNGEEWCDNVKGLAIYPELEKYFKDELSHELSWTMEYNIGTYAALKWYAWRFLEKYGLTKLSELYKTVFECWQKAFETIKTTDMSLIDKKQDILQLLKTAEACERAAVKLM